MIKRFFASIMFILLLVNIAAYAVPVNPFPVEVEQADGTVITICGRGDEFFSWAQDVDGYVIAYNAESENWCYAFIDEYEIKPGSWIVGGVELEGFERITSDALTPLRVEAMKPKITPKNPTLTVGETMKLYATLFYGDVLIHETEWTTSDTDILTISDGTLDQCTIIAMAPGETVVTAIAVAVNTGETLVTATCIVTVTAEEAEEVPTKRPASTSSISIESPTASIQSGTVPKGTAIELKSQYPNSKIYYTTDGTSPAINSTLYTAPITVDKTTTIKFMVVENNRSSSAVTQTYTVDEPVPVPKPLFKDNANSIRYISGYEDTTFKPDNAITRYEVIESLSRLLDFPKNRSNHSFVDLTTEQNNLIRPFYDNGIVNGYDDGAFKADNEITRAEFVKIMSILFDLKEENQTVFFHDVKGHWAETYIAEFSELGYLKGYNDSTFKPENKITRAEFVTIINRMIKADSEPYDNIFTDVPSDHWAYADIMKAYIN